MDVNRISDTMKIFADRLSDLLSAAKEKGDDLRSLSERIGISKSTLSDYANTKREPRITELSRISDFFGVSSDWLLGLTNDRSRVPSAIDELGLSEKAVSSLRVWMESSTCRIFIDLINFICADSLTMFDAQINLYNAFKAKRLAETTDLYSTPPVSFDKSNNFCIASPDIMADYLFDSAEKDIKYLVSVYFDAISGRVKYQNFPQDFYDIDDVTAEEMVGEGGSHGNNKKN